MKQSNFTHFWWVSVCATVILVATATGRVRADLGPDAFGYTAGNVTSPFQDISGTGFRVMEDVDDAVVSADLGFPFSFYETPHSTVFIGSNGVLAFTAGIRTFQNIDLTWQNTFPNVPTICPLWDDWVTFQSADAVYHETIGSPGNRQFIVQWNLVMGFPDAPSPVTFQAVLFEGTNNILFRYLDVISGDDRDSGGSATVGIRDTNGHLNGRRLQWSQHEPVIQNGQAILIGDNHRPEAHTRDVTVRTDAGVCSAAVSAAQVDDGSFDPTGGALTLSLSPPGPFLVGTTAVTLVATDARGNSATAEASVTVVDAEAPRIGGLGVTPDSLWPPDHRMVPVTLAYSASDNCGAVSRSLSVSSSEPINGLGDGDTGPDWEVVDGAQVRLRAERSGKGRGRVYTILITVVDGSGNATTDTIAVTVPHTKGKS